MLSIPGPQGQDPVPGWGANMAAGCKTRKKFQQTASGMFTLSMDSFLIQYFDPGFPAFAPLSSAPLSRKESDHDHI
jgi:hypothetical protein